MRRSKGTLPHAKWLGRRTGERDADDVVERMVGALFGVWIHQSNLTVGYSHYWLLACPLARSAQEEVRDDRSPNIRAYGGEVRRSPRTEGISVGTRVGLYPGLSENGRSALPVLGRPVNVTSTPDAEC